MLQLVYISTSREPLTDALLDSILATSRRNNDRTGVSGLLVAGGRRFLQALEGPAAAVLATYARIAADPRHFAVVQLSCKEVAERQFGAWSMAFQSGGEVRAAGDLKATVEQLIAKLDDPNLRAQFTGFAEIHARAA
jgi:hypothetical protein